MRSRIPNGFAQADSKERVLPAEVHKLLEGGPTHSYVIELAYIAQNP